MLKGHCLCGGVRFEIDGRLGTVIYCHCSRCRRATGSSFATNATVRAKAIRILGATELIREYEWSPGKALSFCSRCGSPLFEHNREYPAFLRIRLGALEDAGGAKSVAHVWIGSKSDWFEIADHLERFEEEPPISYCAPG